MLRIVPYISGLWALPWIVLGFFVNHFLVKTFTADSVGRRMKLFGRILLFVFIPLLIFRLFLNVEFGLSELSFSVISMLVTSILYTVSYILSSKQSNKLSLSTSDSSLFIKSCFTNQGRSSAFIGGALLAVEPWSIPAALFIALYGVFLLQSALSFSL
ncbi:hypothetical protein GEMRC1_003260 [Eukaryota sp. GEM-RC1]